jgi:hypothetical protein
VDEVVLLEVTEGLGVVEFAEELGSARMARRGNIRFWGDILWLSKRWFMALSMEDCILVVNWAVFHMYARGGLDTRLDENSGMEMLSKSLSNGRYGCYQSKKHISERYSSRVSRGMLEVGGRLSSRVKDDVGAKPFA